MSTDCLGGNLNLRRFNGCEIPRNGQKHLDESQANFSKRTINKMHFSWMIDAACTFIAMGLKTSVLVQNTFLRNLEGGRTPLLIVLCEDTPRDLMNCSRPFFTHFPAKKSSYSIIYLYFHGSWSNENIYKSISLSRILTRIWIIQIRPVPLVQCIFKTGETFLAHLVRYRLFREGKETLTPWGVQFQQLQNYLF